MANAFCLTAKGWLDFHAHKIKYQQIKPSHSNLGHGCPIEPMARISDRKFLGKVNYKDVIYFSDSHVNISMPAFEMFAFIMSAN